jgi:hypothetical protein
LFLIFFMFSYIMRVNSENMEDMIFLKSIYSYLGGVIEIASPQEISRLVCHTTYSSISQTTASKTVWKLKFFSECKPLFW